MELTNKQKQIRDRREYVYNAYSNKPGDLPTGNLVKALAKKYNLTEVQIWLDIKCMRPPKAD